MNKVSENRVSVVHLIWYPLGTEPFRNFISSYCKYKSGHPHELVLLFNGFSNAEDMLPYLQIIEEKKIPYQKLVSNGGRQDLEVYFWAAGQLESTFLLYLNSYSQLLAEDWLEKYMQQSENPRIGIVGATGSWQSYYRSVFINNNWKWDAAKSFRENFRKFKLLIKASFYWRFLFPDFPNPHIRTNAFMIRRELMSSLKVKKIKNKLAAYELESGYNSLTSQVLKKGMEAIVIDRWGKRYQKKEWVQARVFWMENQQDLLVSDNQTRKYDVADEETRNKLSYLAWGNSDHRPE